MQDFLLDVWYKTARTFLLITHSVEEAVYTSTEVFVMAPRPGRILSRNQVGFGRMALEGMGARVKAAPEFVETQAEMLAMLTPAGRGVDGP
jgi:NitT/TauT family transport system ATP-binding protein